MTCTPLESWQRYLGVVLVFAALAVMWVPLNGCIRDHAPGSERVADPPRRGDPPAAESTTVECRATVERGQIRLVFENHDSEPCRFLRGDGMPPYTDARVLSDGSVHLVAQFICPLEYVHDCFHAKTIDLGPGQRAEVNLNWAIPDALTRVEGKGEVRCHYETLTSRPVTARPSQVRCKAGVEPFEIRLAFHNPGADPLEFLVGRGMPPAQIQIESDGSLLLLAAFTCPLRHVHDCFHADSIRLAPDERRDVTLRVAIPEQLQHLHGQDGLNCVYQTVTRRATRGTR